jgi:hypothetical protein
MFGANVVVGNLANVVTGNLVLKIPPVHQIK